MSVQRRVNWISQQRVDVPDVRSIESAASNDFDQLIQSVMTGTSQGYIVRGFELSMTGAIGGAASGLQVVVDPGALLHIAASQSGTFLLVPPGTSSQQLNSATNPIVDGAFAPSAINYVGLDYERYIDSTTAAQVYIWDPTNKSETTKTAPRAQILRYRLKVSTASWPSNVLPIATVITDAGNNVVSVTDCRWSFFRLGQGGSSPNPFYVYPWTAQSEGRTENPSSSTSNSINPFHGGDKMLGTLKDWMNAVMTALKEIKGTTYWYSLGTAGSIEKLREDLGNTITVGKGTITHSPITAGLLNWSDPIYLKVIGSALAYQITANASSVYTTLADDQVAYITLTRDAKIVPNLFFVYNGISNTTVVTSIGSIAWTGPLAAGDFLRASSDPDSSYTQIKTVDSLTQVTLYGNYVPAGMTVSGVQAVYALGTYNAVATPTGPRDIYIANRALVPVGQNVFWLFAREDNTGAIPRVYVRFLGTELEQGETDQISDGIPLQLLQYIGSPMETASKPQYVSALNPGSVPQITQITLGAASTITSNQYFRIDSSGNSRQYYVWFKKDGIGVDPMPNAMWTAIEADISTGQTNVQVGNVVAAALTSTFYPDFTVSNPGTGILTVTNTSSGATANASNVNVGAPFAIITTQTGTGTGNQVINDGDSLTLAIKKLDEAIGNILSALDEPSYDENVDIVASGGVPPLSINGPVISGTNITLPLNSRFGNAVQRYTVGNGVLEVWLNGIYLRLGADWAEVGAAGSASNQIQILQGLVVGDALQFRISVGGGSGGGGGGIGPEGPAGPPGPAGADAIGGPVAISTKNSSYSVLNSDNVLLANCSGGTVVFTLPSPASAVGQVFFLKKIDSSVNAMQIQVSGGANIDGAALLSTNVQYSTYTVTTDGTQYWVL